MKRYERTVKMVEEFAESYTLPEKEQIVLEGVMDGEKMMNIAKEIGSFRTRAQELKEVRNMIKTLSKKVIIGATIAFSVLGIGVAYSYISSSENNIETIYADASWGYGYSSIDELAQRSDLVALITIGKVTKEWSVGDMPKTDFLATVKKPIINSKKDQRIIITQSGGITEQALNDNGKKVNIELTDDPLLQPGEEYLIFARKNDVGTYTILGGQQGRLKNVSGKLHAMKYVSKRVEWGNINVNGESVDEIETKILNAKK